MRAELAESAAVFRRILGLTRPYWKHISASMVFAVFYSVLSGASIYFFIPLLDILFHPEKVRSAEPAVAATLPGARARPR